MIFNNEESSLFLTSDYSYIKRMIGEDEEYKKLNQVKSSFAMNVKKYLSDTGAEDIIEVANAVVSGMAIVLYAVETYYNPLDVADYVRII